MTAAAMPMCAQVKSEWRELFGSGLKTPYAAENGHEIITPAYTAEQDRAEAARIERANHFAEQERMTAAWYEREGKERPYFVLV